jgi:hypothetical protein
MHWYFGDDQLVPLFMQRTLAAIYLIGFVIVPNGFKPCA